MLYLLGTAYLGRLRFSDFGSSLDLSTQLPTIIAVPLH